jgi:hypothetical protein
LFCALECRFFAGIIASASHHVAGAACRSAQVWRCDRQPSACRDAVSSPGDLAEHHLVNSLHHLAELAAPTSAGAG